MSVAGRLFSRNQWLNLLKDFADLVADKKYVKINYNDWRALSKPVASNVGLELCSGPNGVPNIFIQPGAHTPIMLKVNDGSLGDFLFDNIFSEEEQAMAYSRDSIAAVSACEAASSIVSDLEVKAGYTDSDGTYISNAAKLTDTLTVTGDSISTANTYQLNIDGYGKIQVYDGTACRDIGICDRIDELENKINQCPTFTNVNKMIVDSMKEKEKEKKNMKSFNFDFGPCTGDQVRLSMYGLAVKNQAGVYVSYNPKTKEIVDVDILNFDGAKYMYKIPVALKDIALGDIIIHNRKPMFVVALSTDGTNTLTCIDVCAGEQKSVIPTTNMFGFNFVTKVVSLFNTIGTNAPSPEAPFGNMLPLMLMDDGNDEKFNPMMLLMMMNQGNSNMNCNPMMLYLMIQDNKDIDPMKWMVLSMMTNSAPAFMTGNYSKQQA